MKKYNAQATSRQMAKEGFVGTAEEINHWLAGWADPENLYVSIETEDGQLYREKPYGKKKIKWTNTTHIKEAFEPGAYLSKAKVADIVHLDYETLSDEIDKFMQKHIFDSLRITCGTIKSYISISLSMNLPTAFLEHALAELELILEGDNI